MFSRPSHRFPTGIDAVFRGTERQTCGFRESGKSMFNGSCSVSELPLMAVITFICVVERHCGTTLQALMLALGKSVTWPIAGAPVPGPPQLKAGWRLKYWLS